MPSTPNEVGPYRLQQEIGRGGMGVVYRGEDSRLGRAVAIKALPAEFAGDPARMNRFEREAKVLASLSHPNIAAVYGLEKLDGSAFLVMEFVEGESLAEMVERSALPVDEAIAICAQIAAAVETAHEAGVIHRDLKPGNVMVAVDGTVKVLDFGLAREIVPKASSIDATASAASFATQDGMVLGTPGYMSPEQARGKQLDKRTDIFSFGCLLYECLTGKRTFPGETNADVLAAILERDPDWNLLPYRTPPKIRELVQRCLEKDARRRLRDIGDARLELQEALDKRTWTTASLEAARGMGLPARRRVRAVAMLAAALVIGVLLGSLAVNWMGIGGVARQSVVPPAPIARVSMTFDLDRQQWPWFERSLRLSPYGQMIAYITSDHPATVGGMYYTHLFTRRLDSYDSKQLPGTTDAAKFEFSPDGRWLVYSATESTTSTEYQLFKIATDGSAPPVALVKYSGFKPRSMLWLNNDEILVQPYGHGKFQRVSVKGGAPQPEFDVELPDTVFDLALINTLPSERHVLINYVTGGPGSMSFAVGLLDLESRSIRVLTEGGAGTYTSDGYLLFTRGEALLAAQFDPVKGELTSAPMSILGGLRTYQDYPAGFELARNGTLLYLPGGRVGIRKQIVAVDSTGAVTPWLPDELNVSWLTGSRDGRWLAACVQNNDSSFEIWITGTDTPRFRRLIRPAASMVWVPTLSPDGSMVAYIQTETGKPLALVVISIDRPNEPRVLVQEQDHNRQPVPVGWTADGKQLIFITFPVFACKVIPVANESGQPPVPRPLFPQRPDMTFCVFSPDGRLVAGTSPIASNYEIVVNTFDNGTLGSEIRVASGALMMMYWSFDGKQLYFMTESMQLMVADIATDPALSASSPRLYLDFNAIDKGNFEQMWPVFMNDGRLLAVRRIDDDSPNSCNLILNWMDELRAKLPPLPHDK